MSIINVIVPDFRFLLLHQPGSGLERDVPLEFSSTDGKTVRIWAESSESKPVESGEVDEDERV